MAKAAAKKSAPKKAAKKAVKAKKEPTLKYADKSAGQPEMVVVFKAIKKLILPYVNKGALKLYANTGGQINLISHKTVVIAGKKREDIWFVSALIQKGYVGFYYMPIYMHDEMQKQFSPAFIKCLKGKACFHIKNTNPEILKDIEKAIRIGYEEYEKRGWV
jgi:hypothetical protein